MSRNTTLCHVTTLCSVTHLSFIASCWWRLGVTIRDREQNHRTLTACVPTTINENVNIRVFETTNTPVLGQFCTEVINECLRQRTVSLFSWSVEQKARDTQMTTRLTEGARERHEKRESLFFLLGLPPPFLARACTHLTKSEEKERLLAVY